MRLLTGLLLVLFTSNCTGPAEKSATPATGQTPAPAAKPADETAAINFLKLVNISQTEYMKRHRRYALTYEELMDARLIEKEPPKDAIGYEIKLRPSADAGSYTIVAVPVSPSNSVRHFFTDKTGVIRAEAGKDAGASSPPL